MKATIKLGLESPQRGCLDNEREAHRCAWTDDHARSHLLSLLRGRTWSTVIHGLTNQACALRDIVLTRIHSCLRAIVRRLSSSIIHGCGRRSRGALVRGRGLLSVIDSEGGIVLGRVGGVFLLRRFVCVFCPRQLFMLGKLACIPAVLGGVGGRELIIGRREAGNGV